MRAAVLIGAAVLSGAAWASPARADAVTPPAFVELRAIGISGGALFGTPTAAVDTALARAGWPALPAASPAFRYAFGASVYGVSLDMHFAGSDITRPRAMGSAQEMSWHRAAIGVDIGYRVRLGRSFSLSPYLGVLSLRSKVCFSGKPDATSSPDRPPFEQIARNPGRGACLETSGLGLEVGLSAAWNVGFQLMDWRDDVGRLYLSFGPHVAYTLAVSRDATWEKSPSSELQVELPPFKGPASPLGGAYVGLELQIRFAFEKKWLGAGWRR